jgi:hypothetical protein
MPSLSIAFTTLPGWNCETSKLEECIPNMEYMTVTIPLSPPRFDSLKLQCRLKDRELGSHNKTPFIANRVAILTGSSVTDVFL